MLKDRLTLDGYLANTCSSRTFPISGNRAVYRNSYAVEVRVGESKTMLKIPSKKYSHCCVDFGLKSPQHTLFTSTRHRDFIVGVSCPAARQRRSAVQAGAPRQRYHCNGSAGNTPFLLPPSDLCGSGVIAATPLPCFHTNCAYTHPGDDDEDD